MIALLLLAIIAAPRRPVGVARTRGRSVSEHDPLCECAIPTHYCGNYWAGMSCTRCDCAKVRRVREAVAEEIAQAIEAFADDWCDWDAIIKAGDDIGALRDMASGVAHDSAAIARRIGGGGSDG